MTCGGLCLVSASYAVCCVNCDAHVLYLHCFGCSPARLSQLLFVKGHVGSFLVRMFRLAEHQFVCVMQGACFRNSEPVCRVVAPLWQQTLVALHRVRQPAGAPGAESAVSGSMGQQEMLLRDRCIRRQGDAVAGGRRHCCRGLRSRCAVLEEPPLRTAGDIAAVVSGAAAPCWSPHAWWQVAQCPAAPLRLVRRHCQEPLRLFAGAAARIQAPSGRRRCAAGIVAPDGKSVAAGAGAAAAGGRRRHTVQEPPC